MSFNNKIIKGLIISILILSIILALNSLLWKVEILESFIISFISGAIVSLFVTCVQYQKEKNDIIYHCNNEIMRYYQLLNDISLIFAQDKIGTKEKIKIATIYFDKYMEINRFREKSIELNFVLNSFDNIAKKKIYSRLYEYSNGIYLIKYFINSKKDDMNNILNICESHMNEIDEGMTILIEIAGVKYPWNEIKNQVNCNI